MIKNTQISKCERKVFWEKRDDLKIEENKTYKKCT